MTPDPEYARGVVAGRAEVEEVHRDLTRRLEFGDNITEPQADNDTIVAHFEQESRDASEWRESQMWRTDCYLAGHPDDEDCHEHDPLLAAHAAGRAEVVARVEGVLPLCAYTPDDGKTTCENWSYKTAFEWCGPCRIRAALADPGDALADEQGASS